jgi:hypothetical protein
MSRKTNEMNDFENAELSTDAAVSAPEIPITQTPQSTAKPVRLVYVGPNVPGGIL